jgi:hypothetical protein
VPGGYGYYGRSRNDFYSNSGAPLSMELLEEDQSLKLQDIERIRSKSKYIKNQIENKFVIRRFQDILDLYN